MTQTTNAPLVKQYEEMKAKHPDQILLFRVGDFYETFKQDAVDCSEILGITLTRRADGTAEPAELAGFPHNTLDTYLPQLVRAGKRVAICEQLEDPKLKSKKEEKKEVDKEAPAKPIKSSVKLINPISGRDEIMSLGEPVAYFRLTIPKGFNYLNKQASKDHMATKLICIEPENNLMIVTNTTILHSVAVECEGIWPTSNPDTPFRCFIDPKTISSLVGKSSDVAVWLTDNGTVVTSVENPDIVARTNHRIPFPQWERVIPQNPVLTLSIKPEELNGFRQWVKSRMKRDKSSGEFCDRNIALTVNKESKTMKVEVVAHFNESAKTIDECEICLMEASTHNWRAGFDAELFYYSIEKGFEGDIDISSCERTPVRMVGEERITVLMPMGYIEGYEFYLNQE